MHIFLGSSSSPLPDKIQHCKFKMADGQKHNVTWKAETECFYCASNVTLSTKSYRALDFQGISNPSNTWQSNHNNTPLRGQTGLLKSECLSRTFGFQMILWKHH